MRVGLIVRAERDRGIGVQTFEMFRHLDPFKVLVIDVGQHESRPIFPEQYGERATVVEMAPDGTLPERKVRRWLTRTDIVAFVETPMDWRVCDWARDIGSRTVCHANAEFVRHFLFKLPHPDGWWLPTSWRFENMPDGTRIVPVPVALDRFPNRHAWRTQPPREPRFLHAVGRWAMYDRAGTETFSRACYLARTLDATITALEPLPPESQPSGDWVNVKVGSVENYWDAYNGYDVLVLPRKYGGLSLSTQEAMASGMAVIMPDISPNRDWPIIPIPATRGGRVPLPAGWMPLADIEPGALANEMILLRTDPHRLAEAREQSLEWAEQHSWEKLTDLYMAELEHVIRHPLPAPKVDDRQHNPFAAPHA